MELTCDHTARQDKPILQVGDLVLRRRTRVYDRGDGNGPFKKTFEIHGIVVRSSEDNNVFIVRVRHPRSRKWLETYAFRRELSVIASREEL